MRKLEEGKQGGEVKLDPKATGKKAMKKT